MTEDGQYTWPLPFWRAAVAQVGQYAGHRSSFCLGRFGARGPFDDRSAHRGLIVNISYWAAQKHIGNTAYGIAKAPTDKMSFDMAH
jgi:dehydrogenase/reductase SDR family protein 1